MVLRNTRTARAWASEKLLLVWCFPLSILLFIAQFSTLDVGPLIQFVFLESLVSNRMDVVVHSRLFFLGHPPDWHLSSTGHQFCQEITLPPPRYAANAMPVDLHSVSKIPP